MFHPMYTTFIVWTHTTHIRYSIALYINNGHGVKKSDIFIKDKSCSETQGTWAAGERSFLLRSRSENSLLNVHSSVTLPPLVNRVAMWRCTCGLQGARGTFSLQRCRAPNTACTAAFEQRSKPICSTFCHVKHHVVLMSLFFWSPQSAQGVENRKHFKTFHSEVNVSPPPPFLYIQYCCRFCSRIKTMHFVVFACFCCGTCSNKASSQGLILPRWSYSKAQRHNNKRFSII